MLTKTKVSGTWRDATVPYIKVAGTWRAAKEAWIKVSGAWRNWFLQGGAQDRSFNVADTFAGFWTSVKAIAVQSDGKIIVGGDFGGFNESETGKGVSRLNADYTRDISFTGSVVGGAGNVNVLEIQTDGKILVGGTFTSFNIATRNRLVRLNSNGTVDTAFYTNLGTAFNNTVSAIAVQTDGKILVGGAFTTLNGVTRNRLVRLNSDGTLDTAFSTALGTGFGVTDVRAIAIQSNGQILVGGTFTTLNGTTRNLLVRLNSDGTEDTTFYTNLGTGFNTAVNSVRVQSDGRILVGGNFTTFNGVTRNRLVRLNSNGTEDTAFYTNLGTGFSSIVNDIQIQSDGAILVGGAFTTFNGVTRNRLVRLNSNGNENTSFYLTLGDGVSGTVTHVRLDSSGNIIICGSFLTVNTTNVRYLAILSSAGAILHPLTIRGFDAQVRAIALQSDKKIVVGGNFTVFDNTRARSLTRLNSDGTLDTAFSTNLGTGFDGFVAAVAIQSDGKILVGGIFTTFNGNARNRLVRLNSNGTEDTAFYTNLGTGFNNTVNAVVIQSDGKILVGGAFTTLNGVSANRFVRLNSDGTRDTAFDTSTATFTVNGISIRPNGNILVVGQSNLAVEIPPTGGSGSTFLGDNDGSELYAVLAHSNGTALISGDFSEFSGITYEGIVRVNSSNTRETAFRSNMGVGLIDHSTTTRVNVFVEQPDGMVLMGGDFVGFAAGWQGAVTVRSNIARLGGDVAL